MKKEDGIPEEEALKEEQKVLLLEQKLLDKKQQDLDRRRNTYLTKYWGPLLLSLWDKEMPPGAPDNAPLPFVVRSESYTTGYGTQGREMTVMVQKNVPLPYPGESFEIEGWRWTVADVERAHAEVVCIRWVGGYLFPFSTLRLTYTVEK